MSPRIFAKVRLTPIAMAYFIANPPALSMPGQGGFFVVRAGSEKSLFRTLLPTSTYLLAQNKKPANPHKYWENLSAYQNLRAKTNG